MAHVKDRSKKPDKPVSKKWYESERYKDFLPPEKAHFPEKLASANESVKGIKWMD